MLTEQMIDPKPGVGLPMVSKIVPERIYRIFRMFEPQSVGPAPETEVADRHGGFLVVAARHLPRANVVNVKVGRHYMPVTPA